MGVLGPMARTVPDLAMLLSVQAGYDPRAPLSNRQDPAQFAEPLKRDFKGTRIAWLGDFGGHLPFEPGVLELCRNALQDVRSARLHRRGGAARLSDRARLAELDDAARLAGGLGAAGLYDDPAKRALMKPEAQFEVESGRKLTAYDISDASVVRTAWYQAVRALLRALRLSACCRPRRCFRSTPTTDWPKEIAGRTMDTYHRWMEVMIPVTMSSCPALAVPVGFNDRGLPMGMQIVGPQPGRARVPAARPRLRRSDELGGEAAAAIARRLTRPRHRVVVELDCSEVSDMRRVYSITSFARSRNDFGIFRPAPWPW